MDRILYWTASIVVRALQALPLDCVARIGRAGGTLAWLLDRRHRRVTLDNLQACFGDRLDARAIRNLARENFKRLGENYCCAVKTAVMSTEALAPRLEWVGLEHLRSAPGEQPPRRVVAIGHFGNFELYARLEGIIPGIRCAATYRALRQPALNQLLLDLRKRSKTIFFERRTEAAALKTAMSKPGIFLGLLVDQHASTGGLWIDFFGRPCSTSAAPAILALRYGCDLLVAICYRTKLAHWRIEIGPALNLYSGNSPRSLEDITREINHHFEEAIRRDPANWFWVHRRWKPRPNAAPSSSAHATATP